MKAKGQGRRARRIPLNKLKGKCPYTGKVRYRDADEAKLALRRLANRRELDIEATGVSRRQETRHFEDCRCLGSHLTSQAA